MSNETAVKTLLWIQIGFDQNVALSVSGPLQKKTKVTGWVIVVTDWQKRQFGVNLGVDIVEAMDVNGVVRFQSLKVRQ